MKYMIDDDEIIDNYEKLFNVAKKELGYDDFTYQEFGKSINDSRTYKINNLIVQGITVYFQGKLVNEKFKNAFDAYYREDNGLNNEFRDNFAKIFELVVQKSSVGELTFQDFLNLDKADYRRARLESYFERVFRNYNNNTYSKTSEDGEIYEAIEKFYKSYIFNVIRNEFKIPLPRTGKEFINYGRIFNVTTSKVKSENNKGNKKPLTFGPRRTTTANSAHNNSSSNNSVSNTSNNTHNSNNSVSESPKKESNKVVKFAKNSAKTLGYTLVVSANVLFGGLGILTGLASAVGWSVFVPTWFPVLAIGIPVTTGVSYVIKNRDKIKNKVTSTISKIKNKFNFNKKESPKGKEKTKEQPRVTHVYNAPEKTKTIYSAYNENDFGNPLNGGSAEAPEPLVDTPEEIQVEIPSDLPEGPIDPEYDRVTDEIAELTQLIGEKLDNETDVNKLKAYRDMLKKLSENMKKASMQDQGLGGDQEDNNPKMHV